MLALTGKLMVKDRLTRRGRRLRQALGSHGRRPGRPTFGSLGIGNIGAEAYRLARPFDMKFIAHDPYADKAVAAELGIELVGIEDLFRRSDILSVSCPLTPETRHIVNAERIALMKPTAYLINTARGPIVDQKALTRALQEKRIAGAGLDVLEQEPPEPDDPILHSTTSSSRRMRYAGPTSALPATGRPRRVKAVIEVQHGREPRGVVNRAVLQTEAWKERLAGFGRRFGG